MKLAMAVAAFCLITTNAHAQNGPPGANGQKPVNLSWMALLELNMPGLGGLRAGASLYLPGAPLYFGFEGAYSWGFDPEHGAGTRDDYFTRLFTTTVTLEGRAGLSFEKWRVPMEQVDFNYDYLNLGYVEAWKVHTYLVKLPTYYRDTFYVGYRERWTPGFDSCKGLTGSPARCSELDAGFVQLGYESLVARNSAFVSREHGTLTVRKKETWGGHLLFTVHDDTRKDFIDHLGVELYWATMDAFGYRFSLGWDGRYFLMTLAVGGANMHSFADQAPRTEDLR